MSLITLLLNQAAQTTLQRSVEGKTVGITLDALLRESLSAEADPTTHPVEDGADITDHVIIRPKRLDISGEVTETPFTLAGRAAGAIATVTSSIGQAIQRRVGATGAFGALGTRTATQRLNKALGGLLGGASDNRQNVVYRELEQARLARQPITIVTGLTRYENYIIRSFSIERQADSGRKVTVNVSLQELLKATSQTIKIPIPKVRSGVTKASLGRQKASDLAAQGAEKASNGSIAYNVIFGR